MGAAKICSNEFLSAVGSKIQEKAVEIRDLEGNNIFSDSRFGIAAAKPIKYVEDRPRFFYRNRV